MTRTDHIDRASPARLCSRTPRSDMESQLPRTAASTTWTPAASTRSRARQPTRRKRSRLQLGGRRFSLAADDHVGAATWPSSGGHVGPVFGPSNADKTRPAQPPRRVPLSSIIMPFRWSPPNARQNEDEVRHPRADEIADAIDQKNQSQQTEKTRSQVRIRIGALTIRQTTNKRGSDTRPTLNAASGYVMTATALSRSISLRRVSVSTTPPERSMIALAASAFPWPDNQKFPARLLLPEAPHPGLVIVRTSLHRTAPTQPD